MGAWLEALDLGRYKDSFAAAGYGSLEAVAAMTAQCVSGARGPGPACLGGPACTNSGFFPVQAGAGGEGGKESRRWGPASWV